MACRTKPDNIPVCILIYSIGRLEIGDCGCHDTFISPYYCGQIVKATKKRTDKSAIKGNIAMRLLVALLVVVASALSFAYRPAHAVEFPIQWCMPKPSMCAGTAQQNNPLYTGDLPANWGDAAQAFCKLFANGFATYSSSATSNQCACNGSVCSTLTSCNDQGIDPANGQYEKLGVSGTSILGNPPHAWTTTPVDVFACGCNAGSYWGFGPNQQCQCTSPRSFNGQTCIYTCTATSHLGMCYDPAVATALANIAGALPPKNADKPKDCEPHCLVGDPFDPGTGINTQRQRLLQMPTLRIELTYNSMPAGVPIIFVPVPFGRGWTMNFSTQILTNFSAGVVGALREGGRMYQFTPGSGNTYTADSDVVDKLVKQVSGTTITGWQYTRAADDAVEQYDASGNLVSVTARNGQVTTLTYSDGSTPVSVAPKAGLLIGISDHFGRQIAFTYNASAHVATMTDPVGNAYAFAYNESSAVNISGTSPVINLTSVTFPGGAKRTYYYNEQANTASTNLANALTGIADENGNRFQTFQYDAQGRTVSTQLAGGVDHYSAAYSSLSTVVTDPLSTTHTYGLQVTLGVVNTTAITGSACPSCGPAAQAFNANGQRTSRTDWNGNVTTYTRADPNGRVDLETSRTEGYGSGVARTISTTWHSTFRLPTLITEPNRTTAFTYDSTGNVLTRTVTDVAASRSRVWTYTYSAIGQVLTIDGPRTDVSDVTTYTYYADNDSDFGKRGNVNTITNALSQVTTITSYDANGRPLTITDPNGLLTTLAYAPRGWITSRAPGSETTTYDYDYAGQLTQVTLPDSSYLQYTYDNAHRLTQVQDNLGNKIAYTLDNMGNRTQEDAKDPSNVLARTRTRVYSSLNRLYQDIGGASPSTEITQYGYDNQGNLTTVTDPLSHVVTNGYDALNRLISMTAPGSTLTSYGYNALDQLTSVTDPRSNATTYTIDALNNLTQQASPDTGTTANTFDAAGNVLTSQDAKSQTTTNTYDALNRITQATYNDGSQTLYGYDAGTNGKGRLTSLTEKAPGGTTVTTSTFTYDAKGRMLGDTRTVNSVNYATSYGYDSYGRLNAVTYPSGTLLSYSFDSAGRVSQIQATPSGGSAATLVSGVTYHPFGGINGLTFGNGQTYSRSYDLDGRVSGFTLGGSAQTVSFDAASRVTGSTYFPNTAQSVTYGYDNLDRLTSTVTPGTTYGFGYDANGNRTSKTVGAGTKTYTYPSTSNKLSSITGGGTWTYSHDADGSVTGDGTNTFTYDSRGRLITSGTVLGTVNYQVNALGQRYVKTVGGTTTVYLYDRAGHLIAETSDGGSTYTEYFWLNDTPVGLIKAGSTALYYIHTDHLNTPRLIANGTPATVWRWDNDDPFGGNMANSNPGGLGTFTFNLRYPGQYFDSETNNHYNYYRDYSPDIGRYVESDPIGTVLFRDMAFRNLGRIGLVAPELGDFLYSERPKYASSYTYVKSSPLSYTDPLGLVENACTPQATSSDVIVVAAGGGTCTWTKFSVPDIDLYTGKGIVRCQYRCPDGSLKYRTHSSILGCPDTALF